MAGATDLGRLPLTTRTIRSLLRSRLRGGVRLTLGLSRVLRSLRRVPAKVGEGQVIYLDLGIAASHGLFAWGCPEEGEQRVMRQVVGPGDIAFDVGGHFGVHTVLLSQLVGSMGHVHVFEPNPRV